MEKMIKSKAIITILLTLFLSASCIDARRFDIEEPDKQTSTPDNPEPDYYEYKTLVPELSGLCFTKNNASLLAVSDHGTIFEIGFNGEIIRQIPYVGNNDFEGITMNHETGDIYLVDEAEMTVYKLSDDETELEEIVKIHVDNAVYNRGLEGITYGQDTLYIVNQGSPTRMFKYDLKSGVLNYIDISYAGYLSDISFDTTDNSLWIVDSRMRNIYHCDLLGNLI